MNRRTSSTSSTSGTEKDIASVLREIRIKLKEIDTKLEHLIREFRLAAFSHSPNTTLDEFMS